MASVSQVIPNYVQGISNQPDQLKIPGQVRDLKNAWPDVTRGCLKRPGSKHIADLNTYSDGTWFTIDRGRNPSQQFLGKVWHKEYGAPHIQVWDFNGLEREVTYADTPYDDNDIFTRLSDVPWNNNDYLKAKKNNAWRDNTDRKGSYKFFPLKVQQGDGKTFLLNDQVIPQYNLASMKELNEHRDKNGKYNYFESFVSLRQVQYQRDYLLAFDDPDKFDESDNVTWDYATSISDTSWPMGNPNGVYFDEQDGTTGPQTLSLNYRRATLNAADKVSINDLEGATDKIVLVETNNDAGEALEISLEVLARGIQKIDRHIKNPAKDTYYYEAEVLPRVQLLKGGKNWKAGDYVTIAYRPDSAPDIHGNYDDYEVKNYVPLKLTIGENGNVTIMADIGYVSVKTTNNEDADATIPFASASDIIQGLCYGLEQAGATPLKFDDKGEEVPHEGEALYSEPGTVVVTFGGSGDENVSEAPVTASDEEPDEEVEESPNTGGAFLEGLGIEFKPIGNGIYMRKVPKEGKEGEPFKLVTPEEQLFNHMSTKEKGEWYTTVHAVSRLPNQCRNGLVTKVMNTENNDDDDYYIKFVGHDDVDGEGSWEECAKPGYRAGIDWNTMPYELIYLPERDSFVVTPIKWQSREVGDENTAPAPSFLPTNLYPKDRTGGKEQHRITGMGWYRNRFLLFSDKHICASADGDYYNFWPKTARTVNDTDPIDISAAAQMPSAITQCMEMTAGLVLFGKEEQFLLTTDADGMRPGTAKVMAISRFNYSDQVKPVKIGQNIAFLSDAGLNDKLFEMSQVAREGSEPQVIELSKLVEPRLPDNIDLLTASKSNMSLFMTKYWGPDYLNSSKNEDYNFINKEMFREVWGYRYYDNGQKRVQSAWFRWTFDWPVCFHVCLDDNYYAVLYDNYGKCMLRKVGLKHEDEIREVYLDGYYTGCPEGACLTSDGLHTIIPIHEGTYRPGDCMYVEMYNKDELLESYRCNGPFEPCKKDHAVLHTYPEDHPFACEQYLMLDGDWTTDCNGNPIDCSDPKNPWRITIGKPFDMVVDFPTVYVGKKEGDTYNAKWDPNLTLHRCKFSVGKQAQYNIEIKRKSRNTVEQWHDVDFEYPYNTEETFVQPVFMRNTDIDMRLICSDPRGGILYSQQWEGDYNPKWYKYV